MGWGSIADEVHAGCERACDTIRISNVPWVEVFDVGGTTLALVECDAARETIARATGA